MTQQMNEQDRAATTTGLLGHSWTRLLDLTAPLRDGSESVWVRAADALRTVSSLGWSVLGLGALSWLLGALLGWTELLIVAAASLALFLCCVLFTLGRTRVSITTEVDSRRVVVGERVAGRVLVTNRSRRGMLPLLVELPVGVGAARFTLPPLRSGGVHEELFIVPTQRRGVIEVGPATTVQGDPLGLLRRTLAWTGVSELFVHPRTTPLESLGAGLLRDLEGDVTEDLSRSDLAFHALREYQPGDDKRYIHWRSSAKTGTLLVRQFLDTRRSHLTVLVDTDPQSYAGSEDAAELAISVAGSLALRTIADEQDTTVLAGGQQAHELTGPLTLDTLSRAELVPANLSALAVEAVALAPSTSIVFVVTGADRTFLDLQRATAQFPPEVTAIGVLIDADGRVGIRRSSGLTLITLGRLDDLHGLLATAMSR
jgi:uncharacterized protein (DUF58 family)